MFAYAGFLMLVPGRESANKRTKGEILECCGGLLLSLLPGLLLELCCQF